MPARTSLPNIPAKFARTKKPLYVLGLIAIVGLAAWANSARVVIASPTTTSAITPALKLAAGTLNLESTSQAVDAASAAKLLPLWQLLAQLDTSASAAPQEIATVVDEIRLNMTSEQIKAIDGMSFSQSAFAGGSSATDSSSAANTGGTQAASAASGPMLVGDFAGGAPMPGGPMPMGGSQSSSSTGSTTSASTSTAHALITEVIQLLQRKVQS